MTFEPARRWMRALRHEAHGNASESEPDCEPDPGPGPGPAPDAARAAAAARGPADAGRLAIDAAESADARPRSASRIGTAAAERAGPGPGRPGSICVASGKGGTGKSVVSASLAALLGARGRTLLVDADLGVGNAHLLQDVSPARTLVDVVQGRCAVSDVVVPCREGLDLLAAGSGVSRMAALTDYELHLVASGLARLEPHYDFVVVDSAAGISDQTVSFAAACDLVVLVTTPDLTAMTDAYAFLKVLLARRPASVPWLVVNRIAAHAQDALPAGAIGEGGAGTLRSAAEHVGERIAQVSLKFLGAEPPLLGALPEDPAVSRSIAARRPVVACEPGSPAAVALQALSVPLLDALAARPHYGMGWSLQRSVGFSSATA